MNSFTGRVAALVLVLFLMVYAGYQAYRYLYSPYKTEVAYEFEVFDTIKTRGLVVRDEQLIPAAISGTLAYQVEEAEKITTETVVANLYDDPEQARLSYLINQKSHEISLLEEIQDPGSRVFTNTELLAGQVAELAGSLVDAASAGNAAGAYDIREQLFIAINKKQLAVDIVDSFEQRISQLGAEKAQLSSRYRGGARSLFAPDQGYFSRRTDGQEEHCTPERLPQLTAQEILTAADSEPVPGVLGKLVATHNWYYAAAVEPMQAEKFTPGAVVYATFSAQNLRDIPMVVSSVRADGAYSIVTLKSDLILPGVLSLRSATAQINFKRYRGLRVSDSAIRVVDGVTGVFIMTGYDIRFRPVEIIYNGPGYKLCRASYTGSDSLNLFDQVIVKGTDLYDRKTIL